MKSCFVSCLMLFMFLFMLLFMCFHVFFMFLCSNVSFSYFLFGSSSLGQYQTTNRKPTILDRYIEYVKHRPNLQHAKNISSFVLFLLFAFNSVYVCPISLRLSISDLVYHIEHEQVIPRLYHKA